MDKKLLKIREQLAKYIATEGCSCCQAVEPHKEAKDELGKLLKVDKYSDGSGYDWYKYKPEENG